MQRGQAKRSTPPAPALWIGARTGAGFSSIAHIPLGNLGVTYYLETMTQVNISLPEELATWVDARIGAGHYAKAGDYVRDLIRKDRDGEAQRLWLRAELQKGLDSGACAQSLGDIHAEYRAEESRTRN